MTAEEAITAKEVREVIWDSMGVKPPDALTDNHIEQVIRRKTATCLSIRALSSLPAVGSQERELVNDGVLSLSVIELKRRKVSSVEERRVLAEEEKLALQKLELLEQSSASNARFDVVGGEEDSGSD